MGFLRGWYNTRFWSILGFWLTILLRFRVVWVWVLGVLIGCCGVDGFCGLVLGFVGLLAFWVGCVCLGVLCVGFGLLCCCDCLLSIPV